MRLELTEDPRLFQRRASAFLEPRVASRCMLSTNLAYPTSDRIYGEIGYRRFAGIDEYRVERST